MRVVAGLWVLGGCLAATPPSEAVRAEAMGAPVRAVVVAAPPRATPVVVHGVTERVDRATLAVQVGGRLLTRMVDVGDRVVAGQPLATVDARALDHARRAAAGQVGQLEAQAAQLEADVRRLEGLARGRSVSDAELDRAKRQAEAVSAALDGARAQAAEAGRQRGESTLLAPFDGVVSAVFAMPGETVAAGQPVLALSGDGATEVRVMVPEAVWAEIHTGEAAVVELGALGRRAEATLTAVGDAASPTGLFPIRVGLLEPAAAGLTAQVQLWVPLEADAVVPIGAVVDPVGGDPRVFRVVDGVAEAVPVVVVGWVGDGAAVTGGVRPGEAVITAGHAALLDGDRVEVIR